MGYTLAPKTNFKNKEKTSGSQNVILLMNVEISMNWTCDEWCSRKGRRSYNKNVEILGQNEQTVNYMTSVFYMNEVFGNFIY